jgi:hypothetical protein
VIRVYVGWDPRDDQAFRVCRDSLLAHASIPVEVIPLKDWELRNKRIYWRGYVMTPQGQMFDDRDGKPFSTAFSFTRFAVPLLEEFRAGLAVFCDADMLWRRDIAELVAEVDSKPGKALYCVQHEHNPEAGLKMDGVLQTNYARKNWSSLMVYRPQLHAGKFTPYMLNQMPGAWLHALLWLRDEELGALSSKWNWLCEESEPLYDPALVHFTLGTPDMLKRALPYGDEWWSYAKVAA